ncbi:hypothetical protein EAS58_14490, partial [Staphylococcus aureus]
DNILVKLFISEIVHTEDSFLLKLYYKFNFATEPIKIRKNKFKTIKKKTPFQVLFLFYKLIP